MRSQVQVLYEKQISMRTIMYINCLTLVFPLARLVEQQAHGLEVTGSSPVWKANWFLFDIVINCLTW